MKIRSIAITPAILLATLSASAQAPEETTPTEEVKAVPDERTPPAETPPAETAPTDSTVDPAPKTESAQPSPSESTPAEGEPEQEMTLSEEETDANAEPEDQTDGAQTDIAQTASTDDPPQEISEEVASESEEAALAAEDPARPPTEAAPTAGFDGGFFVQSSDGKYKMTLGTLVQGRFTRSSQAPESGPAEYRYGFALPRARVALAGHFYSEDLTYRLEMDFDNGDAGLKDYYFDYRLHNWAHLRVGQDRVPFLRQQITRGAHQQFVDRAFSEGVFGSVRDLGITVHNDYRLVSGFEYAVGFYNGTGSEAQYTGGTGAVAADDTVAVSGGSFSNAPAKMEPATALRLGYNNGIDGYTESDLEGGPLRFAVGAAGYADFNFDGTNDSALRATIDGIIKVQRWSITGAAVIASKQTSFRFRDRALEKAGGFLQGGYVINDLLEPAVRWSTVTTQSTESTDKIVQNSYQAGLNLFFHGHRVKWSNDFALMLLEQGDATTTGTEFRSQAQFSF